MSVAGGFAGGFAPRWANSGGPMSRRRTEHVVASLLRDSDTPLRLPRVIQAGLQFGSRDPLSAIEKMLSRAGLGSPEPLRERYVVPATPLLVRVVPNAPWAVKVTAGADQLVLQQALLLGLCTEHLYDPARPVLWTRASLSRWVELYDPAGFYA